MKDSERRAWAWWVLAVAAVAAVVLGTGCARSDGGPEGFGGESHFLRDCSGDDSCPGDLECLGGVCTLACAPADAASTCQALHPRARCAASAGVDTSFCDVSCDGEAACGDGLACNASGQCRMALDLGPADAPIPVAMCEGPPRGTGDAVEVESARIEGDLLSLLVSVPGGCEEHGLSLCLENGWSSAPVPDFYFRLEQEGDGGRCEGRATYDLIFDISRAATLYADNFGEASGFVNTNYGYYIFGDASCRDRESAASMVAGQAAGQLPGACEQAEDCMQVDDTTLCFSGCGQLVAASDLQAWEDTLAYIDEYICGLDAPERGCKAFPQPCPMNPLSPACIDNRCQYPQP